MNLSSAIKISSALAYASGTADRNGAILDMSGWESVQVICIMATIAQGAVTSMKLQQDTASGGGTMADLEGSAITIAADDDDQIFISDLIKPQERYVRVVIDKDASNATAETVIYAQYDAKIKPVTLTVADLVTYERLISPDEGTA